MTTRPARTPLRRDARATRARILEAARRELTRDPDSRLEDIAGAAGVARRTLYVHFAGRAALVEGLAGEAAEAIRLAVTGAPVSTSDAAASDSAAPDAAADLARAVLTLWPVGDRFRTLIRLPRQDLRPDRAAALLAPARDLVTGVLAEGQRQGAFQTTVPPGPLSRAIEAHLLTLLDCVNHGIWSDDGTGATTAALIAAGVAPDTAAAKVDVLRGTGSPPEPR